MERLLDDAEKIKAKYGETADYSVDNLADIVEAIHVVQKEQEISGLGIDEIEEKIKNKSLTEQEVARIAQDLYADDEEGIQKVMEALENGTLKANDALILTGTTSQEANSTIEGSLRSMGAAWENWLVALADPKTDLGQATDDLVERIAIAADNIIPRIGVIVGKLGEFLKEKAPGIVEDLKAEFKEHLPADMQEGFGKFMDDANTAITNFQTVLQTASDIAKGVSDFFQFCTDHSEEISAAIAIVTGAFIGFKAAAAMDGLLTALPGIISAVQFAIMSLNGGVMTLNASMLANPIVWVVGLIAGLVAALVVAYNTNEDFRNKVNEVWEKVKGAVKAAADFLAPIFEAIGGFAIGLATTIGQKIEEIVGFFRDLPNRIKNYFEHPEELLHDIGVQIIKGLTGGLVQDPDAVLNSLSSLVDKGVGWFKNFFGIASPSKLMAEFGKNIATGLANGIDEGATDPENAMQNAANSMYGSLDNATTNASNSFNNAIVQLMGYFANLANSSDEEIANVVRYFGAMPDGIVQGIGDVSRLLYSVGMYLIEGLTQGISNNVYAVMDILMGGVTNAINSVKMWLGIASPSKRMAEIGDYMMQGWTKGIEDEQDSTEKAMLNAAQSIYGAANGEIAASGMGVGSGGILAGGGININVEELVVREEADIDRVAEQLYLKIKREQEAHGWSTSFTMA